MNLVPEAVERLAAEFARLPGIGPKSAQRLSFHCIGRTAEDLERLADAVRGISGGVRECSQCFFMSEGELCAVCASTRRDPSQLCVVEEAVDVLAIERSGEFSGLYHVLGGALSPIEGVGPDQLHMRELEQRVAAGVVREVVIATDPDVEGEATAHLLADRLARHGVTVTRLAHGLPAGADLQYADELTVARAFTGRRVL